MAEYPEDEFDRVPASMTRVGAHRGPNPKGRAWKLLLAGVLSVALLVGAGLLGLKLLRDGNTFDDVALPGATGEAAQPGGEDATTAPAPTATASPAPTSSTGSAIDKGRYEVAVYNSSSVVGLAKTFSSRITQLGWKVVSTSSVSAPTSTTVVYYGSAANRPAAQALAEQLPGAKAQESLDYFTELEASNGLVVVVGSQSKTS